jgi:hypothetical protein
MRTRPLDMVELRSGFGVAETLDRLESQIAARGRTPGLPPRWPATLRAAGWADAGRSARRDRCGEQVARLLG